MIQINPLPATHILLAGNDLGSDIDSHTAGHNGSAVPDVSLCDRIGYDALLPLNRVTGIVVTVLTTSYRSSGLSYRATQRQPLAGNRSL